MKMISLLASLLGAACGAAPPSSAPGQGGDEARRVLDEAIAAVGGRDAIAAAKTLVIEGEAEYGMLGQTRRPDLEAISYRATGVTLAIDLVHGRSRISQTMTPQFPATSPAPVREQWALDGEVAFDLAEDGTASRRPVSALVERRDDLRHSVLVVLRAAIAPGASAANHRRSDGRDLVDVRAPDGVTYTIALDGATRLPSRISSPTTDGTIGDVTFEAELADYRPVGALRLPGRLAMRLVIGPGRGLPETALLWTMRVARATVDAAIPDLAAPPEMRAPAPAAPPPALEPLAPGVWLIAGGSHHSVLVERSDHLLLIEAPRDDERTLAVIAAARAQVPDKPLTHVVCTHHHFDHSGGIRAAVAEGLAVIAHEAAGPFLTGLVAGPRTRAPDALARRPRPLALTTVSGERTLADPLREVRLYAVDSRHAGTMLVAYLPRERLLVEVDLYTQPPTPDAAVAYPNAPDLLRAIDGRKLAVDRIVPLHRRPATLDDLRAAAARPGP